MDGNGIFHTVTFSLTKIKRFELGGIGQDTLRSRLQLGLLQNRTQRLQLSHNFKKLIGIQRFMPPERPVVVRGFHHIMILQTACMAPS